MQNRTEVPAIVTKMDGARREDDKPGIIHVYKLEGGGIVFTTTPVEVEDDLEENFIIDAKEPETDTRPNQQKAPLYLLQVLFLFIVFVGLDNVDAFLMML